MSSGGEEGSTALGPAPEDEDADSLDREEVEPERALAKLILRPDLDLVEDLIHVSSVEDAG